MDTYVDFEIAIDPPTDSIYPIRVRTANGQEARDTLKLPTEDVRYTNFKMALDYGTGATENQVFDFGVLLYETLLRGKIWGAFTTARDRAAQERKKLRIKFSIDPTHPALVSVAAFPWEFACDDVGIPLTTRHSFCRFIPLSEDVPATEIGSDEILKVLLTSALPSDLKDFPLDIDAEIAAICLALKPLEDEGALTVVEIPHLTGLKLQRAIRKEKPHILHYVGHGTFEGDMGALVLEKNDGTRQDMSARTLATILQDSPVRLVVLNACKTGMVVTNLLRGMAPALMGANIPAVVAMQSSVLDDAGLAFAEEFYRTLADGNPIDGCVAEGRKAIITCGLGNLDWGLATLYMRAKDGILFKRTRGDNQQATPQQAQKSVSPDSYGGGQFDLKKVHQAAHHDQTPPNPDERKHHPDERKHQAEPTSRAHVDIGSGNNFNGGNFSFGNVAGGNISQTTTNYGSASSAATPSGSSGPNELQKLINLRNISRQNLYDLEFQEAKFTKLYAPVHITNQIRDLKEELAQLDAQIKQLGG